MLIVKSQKGFTLIEIAIVLLIVTILLGYTVAMVPVQQELKQYRQADAEMNRIIDSLYAFAQVNGYLPCPAWVNGAVTSDGFECRDVNNVAEVCKDGAALPDPTADSCDVWYGFVPGKTLGIEGKYSDTTGLLLDPWGMPYRYQVTDVDNAGPGSLGEDFVFKGDMQIEEMANLAPDLVVCNKDPTPAAAGTDTACASAADRIINISPVIIMSTGKDLGNVASLVQSENLDNDPADTVFVKTTRNDAAGDEYDDLVKWISPNILYSKMIEAGQLP